jgi:diguanylate cyclase (GGDEF)-like protein/PAS domain S-box-containing protein
MPDQKHQPLLNYLLSIILVTASLAVTLVLWPGMRETPFVLLFFAVLLSSWRGGYGAGLIATALSAVVSKLFLMEPTYSMSFTTREDLLRLLVFVFNSLLFVWLFSTRKATEEALRTSEESLRELFENASDIIYTHDPKGNFTSLNLAGQRITGYTLEEALHLNIAQVVAPKYLKTAREMIERSTEEAQATRYELEIFARDGRRIPLEVSTRVIMKRGQALGVQGIARDITERRRTEETLRSLSLIDDLTGLYNRRGFLALAEQQVKLTQRTGHGFTLVFADLDGLKKINDTHGHKAGDGALRAVAEMLKSSFRESDIIARLGGDEFTILALEDYEAPARRAVTARLMENLKKYARQENRPYDLSLSIGVVHFNPESGCSLEELIAQADTAMYEEKQGKKEKRELQTELVM